MAKKNSFVSDLIKAPWWVSLILAGVAYIINGIVPGIVTTNLAITMISGMAKGVAPIAIIFFLVMALVSFICQFQKLGNRAKQSSSRKQASLTDNLILGPWWICLVLAGVVLLVSCILPSISSANLGIMMVVSVGRSMAPVAVIALLFIALFSFLRSVQTRAQLKRQQSVDTLKELSWKGFENITGELFRQRGYRVEEMLGGGADGGVDLRLRKNGQLTLVQCKRWKNQKVGLPVVRELLGAMTAESADKGMLITTSTFTRDAINFAQDQGIQLTTGAQLNQEIQNLNSNRSPAPEQETRHEAITATPCPPPLPTSKESTTPLCPRCNQPMKLKTAKRGPNPGNKFWGCSTFPKCRGIINL